MSLLLMYNNYNCVKTTTFVALDQVGTDGNKPWKTLIIQSTYKKLLHVIIQDL